MQLGSIHPDERSARQAVHALVGAGIAPDRIKLVRSRARNESVSTTIALAPQWSTRLRELLASLAFGTAIAVLACALLAGSGAEFFLAAPAHAAAWLVGCTCLAAVLVTLGRGSKPVEVVRRAARRGGWAVIVDARDMAERAHAASALRSAALRSRPLAA